MPRCSVQARPVRLQLLLPAAPLPRWLDQCVQLLAALPDIALCGPSPADDAAADVQLALADPPPRAAVGSTQWLLCDGQTHALHPQWPLLHSLTAGQGLALQLLQRSAADGHWHLRRTLHVAAPSRYSRALQALPAAVARLLGQALVDHALAVACAAAVVQPLPAAALRPGHPTVPLLAGLARAWLGRQRARWLSEFWRIGVIDAPIHTLLTGAGLPPVQWITPDQMQGHWADPFGHPDDAQRLSCEHVDERSGVGQLQMLQLDGRNAVTRHTRLAVGGGLHASFPHVCHIDGRRLAVAETVATRQCLLHAVADDGQWHPLHPLLSDVAAADPALFAWQGRYWLAYTDVDRGAHDNLCLQHAPTLQGPWQPHANNPVRVDVTGARMAGRFFSHDGVLYRPGQDCLATYGAAVVVYRVLRLTPEAYEEAVVQRWTPDRAGPCPHGLHTLTAWGARTLVDGKRLGINPLVLRRKLARRVVPMPALAASPSVARLQRVCVYVPHLRLGGGETSMLRLAAGFVAAGLQVDLVVHTLQTAEIAVPAGVHVHSLDCQRTAAALPRLAQWLRRQRPQWLLSAFPHSNLAAVAAAAWARCGTRCIVSEHAPLSRQIQQQAGAAGGGWHYRLLPPAVRWAYRRAAAVVAVSDGVRDDLRALLGTGTALHVIANPVLPPGLDDEVAQPPSHPWLLDPALQVVLGVCRLSPEKDLPMLVRAFAALHAQRPQTRLLLAGDGPERAALQTLVDTLGLQAVAQLPGRTDQPLRWMRHAAVFALASRYEGFGNVLVEAMACGTPVVSTDCPVGPRDILQGGRLGTLVPVGDAAAMAAALAGALDADGPPPQARQAALRYTHAAACAAYLRLFDSLLVRLD